MSEQHRERAKRLWGWMEGNFGAGRWKTLRGAEPPGAWVHGIVELTDAELRRGLLALRDEWEPTPDLPVPDWPTFRALAKPRDGRTPEQRARDARIALEEREQKEPLAALPGPEQLARGSEGGRVWLGYWYLRGIRPMPRDVSMDDVDALIGDADVGEMDAAMNRHRVGILGRLRVGQVR